jgi:hypothetical protein
MKATAIRIIHVNKVNLLEISAAAILASREKFKNAQRLLYMNKKLEICHSFIK